MNEKLAVINSLQPAARELRSRQEEIEAAKKQIHKDTANIIVLVTEQGRCLIDVKSKLGKHVRFSEWLKAHCPSIKEADASKFERVATEQITDARQACFAFFPPSQPKPKGEKRTPASPHEVAFGYANKIARVLRDNPPDKWPAGARTELVKTLSELIEKLGGEAKPLNRTTGTNWVMGY